MHVTLKVEPAQKPAERFEYGGFFSRKVYQRKPEREVYQVFTTVHFEDAEREIIRQANLDEFILWQGPEKVEYHEKDLKWNLDLVHKWPRFPGVPYVDQLSFLDQIDLEFRHLLNPPIVWREAVRISDLASGTEVLVCECETLAEANTAEEHFREALVILKKALAFNNKPASRVTTFEL